ncbi:MAG: 1,4-dihydroxy-2-naphthoate octaprenyltransferase [Bacteroidota bacterium]|jgi:1,4-dihydroxy-2-naphthoate octaprenyltransferase
MSDPFPKVPSTPASPRAWLNALRLRTLPLAAAAILLPAGLLALQGKVQFEIVGLALLTAFLLQILSNLANDYGDALSGADRNRIGPARMVASGQISPQSMRWAILVAAAAALASGLTLLRHLQGAPKTYALWLGLGLLAVAAAVRYTVGRRPYGYRGLGEVAVILFFGPVAYAGIWALHGVTLTTADWGPALGTGLLAASVLNLNNLRDREEDAQNNKITLAVRLGDQGGRLWHSALLGVGLMGLLLYAFPRSVPLTWGWALMTLAYSSLLRRIWQVREPAAYDAFLKPTALYLLVMALMPWILYWRTP